LKEQTQFIKSILCVKITNVTIGQALKSHLKTSKFREATCITVGTMHTIVQLGIYNSRFLCACIKKI
jgi:hypothetical protein